MQQRAVVEQVRRVGAAGHVAVDRRVQAAEDVDGGAAEVEPVAGPAHHGVTQAEPVDDGRGVDVDHQARARVRGQQRGQPGSASR